MKNLLLLPFLLFSITVWCQNEQNTKQNDDGWREIAVRLTDIDSVRKTGNQIDFLISGSINPVMGTVNDYLTSGNGLGMSVIFRGRKKIGGGFNFLVAGNSLEKPYPGQKLSPQTDFGTTIMFGGNFNRILSQKGAHELSLQIELNYAAHQFQRNSQDELLNYASGLSPALILNYGIRIGKEHIVRTPNDLFDIRTDGLSTFMHFINFHAGMRPLFLSQRYTQGIMFEIGVGYKFRRNPVSAYKLKPNMPK